MFSAGPFNKLWRNLDRFSPTIAMFDCYPVSPPKHACLDWRISRFLHIDTLFLVPPSVEDRGEIVCDHRVVLEIQIAILEEVTCKIKLISGANTPMESFASLEICN